MNGPIPARVERVVDGDTLDVRARIWLGQEVAVAVRLKGVNAPEPDADCAPERARARAARSYLTALVKGGTVLLSDIEADKYAGRVDAVVTLPDGRDVSAALLRAGLVAVYDGGRREDFCPTG